MKRNISLLALMLALAFAGCESFNFNKDKPSKNIMIDELIDVASQTIPQTGGTVVVNNAGSEIDGMKISVKPNSYTNSRTFKVSTANIASHKLGEHFKPLSPLIQIENGGGYSEEIMEITIPIKLPEGHFAMGFFYDEATGRVEGIPTIELTSTSITLASRHLMASNEWRIKATEMKSGPVDFNKASKIIISSMSEATLKGMKTISTGFKPGVDDFEFTNYGSIIAPNGHCAGQSISMMYYFYERKPKGADPLFGTYQMLDNIWQDNPDGFRLSSVVQKDLQWDGKLFTTLRHIRVTPEVHYLSWHSFAYSMLVSGSPQYVGLTSSLGGHAIVAHKISLDNNILYVTDPNFPGSERQIKFENGKFSPYSSKQNMNEVNNNSYTGIGYTAVSALIDWDKVSKRFEEFDNHTIGDIAPNAFPEYSIVTVKRDGNGILKNGYSNAIDTLRCYVSCPSAEMRYQVGTESRIGLKIFNDKGQNVSTHEGQGQNYTVLKPGKNTLGFYVFGWVNGKLDNNNKLIEYFVDFEWMDVYFSTLSINPNPILGEPNKEIIITARSKGTAPTNAKYVWDFGDGSKPVTVNNDSIIKRKFSKEGEYNVQLSLYDRNTDKQVGFASAKASIMNKSNDLAKLQQSKYIYLKGDLTFIVPPTNFEYNQSFHLTYLKDGKVQWEGPNFSLSYKKEADFDNVGWKTNYYRTITGTVSNDIKKIVTISFEDKTEYYRSFAWSETKTEKVTIVNLPLVWKTGDKVQGITKEDYLWEVDQKNAAQQVTFIEWRWTDKAGKDTRYNKSMVSKFTSPIRLKFREDYTPYE